MAITAFRVLPEEQFSSKALLELGFPITECLVIKRKALYVRVCHINPDGHYGDESVYALFENILWRDSGSPIHEPQSLVSSVLESYQRGQLNGNIRVNDQDIHWYVP